jgi:hypothetical protein
LSFIAGKICWSGSRSSPLRGKSWLSGSARLLNSCRITRAQSQSSIRSGASCSSMKAGTPIAATRA